MVGNNLTEKQLQEIVDKTILYSDKDGDGKISFQEFCDVSNFRGSPCYYRRMFCLLASGGGKYGRAVKDVCRYSTVPSLSLCVTRDTLKSLPPIIIFSTISLIHCYTNSVPYIVHKIVCTMTM